MYEIPATARQYPYQHANNLYKPNGTDKMQRSGLQRRTIFLLIVFILIFMLIYTQVFKSCSDENKSKMYPKDPQHYVYDSENKGYPYDRNMPLIFIGGVPRSGTTLMRAMLDAHPDVRCGEETRVIPRVLGMRGQWAKSQKETTRLHEAGLSDDVIDDALSAFILEVIAKHGEAAPRLCNKDPFTLKSSVYLAHLFPNSKFILMIRDGRAVVNSIITRKVTISGFDLKSFPACLKKWNAAMESMYYQCLKVGSSRCLPVYYEQLVLHPELWLKHILEFLDIPWDNAVLHHEEFINKPGGISLSKTERSTDQVVKPVNVEALTAWVDHVPKDIRADIASLAPMLDRLGYDPYAFPPNYGQPDKPVLENSLDIKNNAETWRKRSKEIYQQPKLTFAAASGGKVVPHAPGDNREIIDKNSRSGVLRANSDTQYNIDDNSDQNIEEHIDYNANLGPNDLLERNRDNVNKVAEGYKYRYVYNKADDDVYGNKGS